ncbi:hypothetical protein D770_09130 [Flammeovirgaceae bacterium 311]|nr:hypothetical protein D770_09130 [Flammeovirgaceae bacterium 311]
MPEKPQDQAIVSSILLTHPAPFLTCSFPAKQPLQGLNDFSIIKFFVSKFKFLFLQPFYKLLFYNILLIHTPLNRAIPHGY